MAEPRDEARKITTPPGSLPLVVSAGLLLVTIPAVLAGLAMSSWIALVCAFLFLAICVVSAFWSYRVYVQYRGTADRIVPMIAFGLALFVVFVAGSFVVPAAMR